MKRTQCEQPHDFCEKVKFDSVHSGASPSDQKSDHSGKNLNFKVSQELVERDCVSRSLKKADEKDSRNSNCEDPEPE